MNINKLMNKAAIVAVSLGLAAASAHAGPPRDSGRDVIGEAQAACEAGIKTTDGTIVEIFGSACDLLWKTNGAQVNPDGNKCKVGDVDTNGYVEYTGRNCYKNEAALERQAGSVILSTLDIAKGKQQQRATAAKSACTYAGKAEFLEDVGKLNLNGHDLIGDAEKIADAVFLNGHMTCEEYLAL